MAEQGSPPTLSMVVEAAQAGDGEAIEVLTETGHLLGVGVANLINIFNPEMVVLGGPLSTAGDYLIPAIDDAIRGSTLSEIREQAEILLSAFGADASLIGAVALVVDDILAHPSNAERLSTRSRRVG
jgi:predicted NBD/HSP70 family sugar kinase